MAAAAAAAAAARSALLKHLRVTAASPASLHRAAPFFFAQLLLRHRGFSSEEVRGTFLDKSEVADRIITVVKNFQKVDPSKVTPNAHFQKDLGLDSLDGVEIVMALEEEFSFEIPDNEADKIDSISVAVDFIASHPQAK
ncbi:acyl carrier protein 2, mitochondrial-like [Phoenix dactylifera]|uniref:Acyl carrier protein n=1 Tax=Phoenix dactylifera TaxID=42345 RepID=A0A8B7BXT8_PHODC|nr:acyl carrier protein 2, mitochondrial-like [Phoenix dactylifera]